ncbi:alkaline phosphatase [Parashewanella curva]|uniref:Alkaline phosphatase n=1 Tax=Parashewanella curva TaxID=2338552 RepID=A0A3L8PXZ1_9GAMM|nr:alkaline phosphatase [Parashewanella curva]RLV60194.1 alkaline phosphatase [Parashewanella curva]
MKLLTKISILATSVALAACNGDDGQNGTDGKNGQSSFVLQTVVQPGHAVCANGGIQIDSGLDKDGNGKLDAGEITSTTHQCKPTKTSLSQSDLLTNANNNWYVQSAKSVEDAKQMALKANNERGGAKNVILFVGDGMGVSTVTAARIRDGQNKGMKGEENNLSFDKFPFAGLAKTYNVDAQTPDSAGTMTAMISGVKTDVGVLGVDEDIERGNCTTVSGNELVSAIELAEIAGLSTGVISTARITHATPAATYAKSADRNWEDISDMPDAAKTAGCKDIADQLVNFETNLEARYDGLDVDGLEVVMGGGRRHFLPKDAAANSPDARSDIEGDRTDGRNLVNEWKAKYPNGDYVFEDDGFRAINPETAERIFGLFNESHMQYEADRSNDVAGEPSLTDMTEKAIKLLDNNDKGYMLVVESGRIDHGHHAGNAYNALEDTIEFSEAIEKAVRMTNPEETLIIVTADHSHVFTIAGYPKRGNPILGKVVAIGKTEPEKAADDKPYTTLGYTNGRGFMDLGAETDADAGYDQDIHAGRADLTDVDTTTPGFHQEAAVPRSSETHAGEDVGIYAKGPSAQLVSGTNEQSIIFHVMEHAIDLINKAETKLKP